MIRLGELRKGHKLGFKVSRTTLGRWTDLAPAEVLIPKVTFFTSMIQSTFPGQFTAMFGFEF